MTIDYSKIAFSSQYRYEYIALKGHANFSISTTFPGTQPTITIAHNLGYNPFFRLFYTFGDGKFFQMSAGANTYNIDGNGVQVNNIYTDTTNLYIQFLGDGVHSATGTIYYRIYAEPQA